MPRGPGQNRQFDMGAFQKDPRGYFTSMLPKAQPARPQLNIQDMLMNVLNGGAKGGGTTQPSPMPTDAAMQPGINNMPTGTVTPAPATGPSSAPITNSPDTSNYTSVGSMFNMPRIQSRPAAMPSGGANAGGWLNNVMRR